MIDPADTSPAVIIDNRRCHDKKDDADTIEGISTSQMDNSTITKPAVEVDSAPPQICINDSTVPTPESTTKASDTGNGKTRRSRKRLNSFNGQNENGKQKYKRQSINGAGEIILPNKFLLGGNITDPLNLNSMLDEKVNLSLNASTPSSSPLPPRNTKINMIIPDDMTDPLGLNIAEQLSGSNIQEKSGKPTGGRRKRRRRKSSLVDKVKSDGNTVDNADQEQNTQLGVPNASRNTKGKKGKQSQKLDVQQSVLQPGDPIVSPVVPQDVKNVNKRSADPQTPRSRKKRPSQTNPKSPCKSITDKGIHGKNSVLEDKGVKGNLENTDEHNDNKKLRINNGVSKTDKGESSSQSNTKSDGKSTEQHYKEVKSLVSVKSTVVNKETPVHSIKFKPHLSRYQYGNYNKYYGYRNQQKFSDPRMSLLEKEWFKDKDVLDVGCNVGHLTILIARDYSPRKIVGVDIDEHLIKAARSNIRHYATAMKRPSQSSVVNYPNSMALMFGPIVGPTLETGKGDSAKFPNNITFLEGNYVPEKKELVQFQEPEYDVIMCMSVTKWIHLNWGDKGLKDTFVRFFKQLRPGGLLILEPQEWKSYAKKKKLTEKIYRNFNEIKFKPPQFPRYLIQEIGFEKVEYLSSPFNSFATSKGFQRTVQVYYKPE